MTVKEGVDISKLHPTMKQILAILDSLWPVVFPGDVDGLNVTSGHEENDAHGKDSKHYLRNCASGQGEAFDCRVKDVPRYLVPMIATLLWMLIQIRFDGAIQVKMYGEDILGDNAHLHVQLR
jgi:hypothetical protein